MFRIPVAGTEGGEEPERGAQLRGAQARTVIHLECRACESEVGIHCLSPTCDLAVCSRCGTLLSRDGRRREERGERRGGGGGRWGVG